jgi:hypothetical protein
MRIVATIIRRVWRGGNRWHNNRMAAESIFRPDVPSTARMYDYYLGGKDNYPADRAAAEKAMAALPPGRMQAIARENRRFLGRVVRFLADEAGIRQFLDIGTGLPIMNQVHEVAQTIDEDCHVLYVDNDPVVLAHGRDMLDSVPNTDIIKADLRQPEVILHDPQRHLLLDLRKPVALLLVAILHFIKDDEDPAGIIRTLMEPLAPGSYLAISHATGADIAEAGRAGYAKATSQVSTRSREEIASFFDGLDLVEPGLVWLPEWRPDADTGMRDNPEGSRIWCAVGRKPL